MTAMPQNGNGGRNNRRRSRDRYQRVDYGDNAPENTLAVVFERLDANDEVLQSMSAQMAETVRQLSAQSGAIQVLTTNDANLKAQIDAHATELREWRDWRLQFMTQFGQMQTSLESKIQQAVTTALKETQTVERRADDRTSTDQARMQGYLVTALLMLLTALLGAILTYVMTHPHG